MYKEYSPSAILDPYIDKYWISNGFIQGSFNLRIAADGCADIILASGENATSRQMKEFHPYIVGTMETYGEELLCNHVNMMGIRFKPAGITAFIQNNIYDFTNIKADLSDVESIFGDEFYSVLMSDNNFYAILLEVDNYLIRRLPYRYKQEKRIVSALLLINRLKGIVSSGEVADYVCLSQRQFERLFKYSTGISPKTYGRIVRYKNTRRYLQENPKATLFSAAIDCGYYDHSHLIKDFQTLSGEVPKISMD